MALWVVVIVVVASQWRGAAALGTAQVGNGQNVVATAALDPPGGLVASASGRDVALSWTAGRNGDGYAVAGAANGASADCSGVSLTALGSTADTSFADSGRYLPQGSYFCYRVRTTSGTGWTSQQANPTVAARLGHVVTSVTLANGGLAGTLDAGDRVVLTFNQPVDPASGPTGAHTVCATLLGSVLLGSTTASGACSGGETVRVGTLSGVSVSATARWAATYAWSDGNRTLTVTVGARVSGLLNPVVAGPWSFAPTAAAATLLSAVGGFPICTTDAGGGLCLPAVTGLL